MIAARLALALLLATPALGQAAEAASEPPKKGFRDLLTDDQDGHFDVSEWLFARPFNFLPIPILVTEPAVGYGFGLAPVWFHQRPDQSSGRLIPPSVSVLAGALTDDGSQVGGGGHFHSWKSDTWRLLGFAGRASLDLESTGFSPVAGADQSINYLIDTGFLLLEGSRKMSPRTRIGLRYVYAESEVSLDGAEPSSDRPLSGDSAVGGLGLLLSFDSRDSVITPTKGHRLDLRPAYFGELFGGEDEFFRVDAVYTGYWVRGPVGFALRLDGNWIEDGSPFYVKPFITLRGVPAMAFLGQEVLSAESEIDWNVRYRWTLLAFGGAGRASNDSQLRGEADRDIYAGGVGFRYLLSRVLGMKAGLDFAWSSEGDHAFYIVMGSPWR